MITRQILQAPDTMDPPDNAEPVAHSARSFAPGNPVLEITSQTESISKEGDALCCLRTDLVCHEQ